ncbi:MAG: hypothetical protein AAB429_01565 [Patescibacteria group bacterium]
MSQNALVLSARYFLIDLVWGLAFFPLWWYSRGLWRVAKACSLAVAEERRTLAIAVWAKNLFVPMYGTRDFWGRLISFFIRAIQIIGRLLVLVVYALIAIIFFAAYLILPVVIVWQILFHAVGALLL